MTDPTRRIDLLSSARAAFDRRAWGEARARLVAADAEEALGPDDLLMLAAASFLVGEEDASVEALARAHGALLAAGDGPGAARAAFLAAFHFFGSGEGAHASGWLGRARRALEEHRRDCVEHGYLLVLGAAQRARAGALDEARATFERAEEVSRRFGDADLAALVRLGQGQALVASGEIAEGTALLDEVMLSVTADEVSPIFAGVIYCSVIEVCHGIYDMRRAHEWTLALGRWCDEQPDLVPYRGQCLVRRAEIMRLRGAWPDALEAAARATEWLSRPSDRGPAGAAMYQQAELFRLLGELDQAEEAYRSAARAGRTPQPGLAQLRLAQGNVGAAVAAIRGVLDEIRAPRARARVLPAAVDVLLETGDVAGARTVAEELAAIAHGLGAPLLLATSARAEGAVLLAEGEPGRALAMLREACALWRELDAPYEAARTRVLMGLACHALGDQDGEAIELEAARENFERLGASWDLERLRALRPGAARPETPAGLTAREVEVLRLVATGMTNKAVARELCISEKTVARHLSNIFGKTGVGSRSAATAYAYEHGLV